MKDVDPKSRLAVACVGLGYFSQFHLDGWSRIDETEIVAVCDLDLAKATAAADGLTKRLGSSAVAPQAFDEFDAMLAATDPDILDIATPPTAHADYIRRALRRPNRSERAIICQKPFCRDLAEAAAVAEEAKAAGATVVVHENFRFQPWHRAAKRMIEGGQLGEIYQATFRLRPGDGQGPRAYLDRQPFFQQMERFLVHETAIHFIDTFRFLLGEATSVYADLRQLNPAIRGEDAGLIVMTHASGARSVFDGNRLSDHIAENRRKTMGEMVVEGAKGALRLDGEGRLFFRAFGANAEAPVAFSYEDRGFGGDCVKNLQQHVVDHLTAGAALENEAGAYVANIAVEEAAYRSHETGARVSLR